MVASEDGRKTAPEELTFWRRGTELAVFGFLLSHAFVPSRKLAPSSWPESGCSTRRDILSE